MSEYKVGDRVKYIGPYVINNTEKDPREDLIPGLLGTVIDEPRGYLRVRFDDHRDNFSWPMFDEELEPAKPRKKTVEVTRKKTEPTWAEVQEAVRVRIIELDALIEKHLGTEHAYPLKAGKFELLRLVASLQDKHS